MKAVKGGHLGSPKNKRLKDEKKQIYSTE